MNTEDAFPTQFRHHIDERCIASVEIEPNMELIERNSVEVEMRSNPASELAKKSKIGIDEPVDDETLLDEMVLVPVAHDIHSTQNAGIAPTNQHAEDDTEKSYVQIPEDDISKRSGVVFIEGQLLKDHPFCSDIRLRQELHNKLLKFFSDAKTEFCFVIGADLLADEDAQYTLTEPLYQELKESLSFLRVVEYLGPASKAAAYHSHDVDVKVDVYGLYKGDTVVSYQKKSHSTNEEQNIMEQAQVSAMPNVFFDGIWERLVFDDDIKEDLVWIMTNLLRFSKLRGDELPDINPVILLHGPPGTGKTSLCQGLAQKISIRLSFQYTNTILVQVKTSTLLSKYFSESAKKVDDIFSSVDYLCKQDPLRFICVLIDEVESIAACREITIANGEAQDSLRATNTLLTGIDRVKVHSNLMILCTSNMVDTLDAAFLDRCGLSLGIDTPSEAAQYFIIKERLEALMARGVIKSKVTIPSYRTAVRDSYDLTLSEDLSSARLLHILKKINGSDFSGRSVTQLPEISIMRYLRDGDCNLNMALNFMDQFVLAQQKQNNKRKREHGEHQETGREKVEVKIFKDELEEH